MSCHEMIDMTCVYSYYYLSVSVIESLKSPLLTLTAASCCVCLLSDFRGLTCVHQNGLTALMWAVYGNCRRSVELLLDAGANTEIRDKVCDVMSCLVTSCHVISYDRRSLTHLSEALYTP